ncbi:MAG TPA: winged helix-turn-helix transcriptional regulator, partial [Anaerolineaceae bacterium]|nr:winged helix-turn-helix transcriptional regulator [Anaerolineaceae bacterium]
TIARAELTPQQMGFIIQSLNYMEQDNIQNEPSHTLEMLTHIEANPDISQVGLATELGVAVGTINWHLKRMINKGYVKVKRAQRKKLRYIITPEGIALRAALTVDYIKNSFNLYRLVRERTLNTLKELRYQGYEQIRIEGGEDEVAEVARLTCIEQGVSICDKSDSKTPTIYIQGIKLALKLPGETSSDVAPETENRGAHVE